MAMISAADANFKYFELERACKKAGMRDEAIADVLMRAPEYSIVTGTDGARALIHTESLQPVFDYVNVALRGTRPHYWPLSFVRVSLLR
jgi:hypothetical protein